ncbi:MAG: hypothetical protein MPJ24_09480 [Pirellulaceae bacterium]|nr:hypothetical protein [Pirellulaceae bacterium]
MLSLRAPLLVSLILILGSGIYYLRAGEPSGETLQEAALQNQDDRWKQFDKEFWNLALHLEFYGSDEPGLAIDISSVKIYLYEEDGRFRPLDKLQKMPTIETVEYSFEYQLKEDWEFEVFKKFGKMSMRPVNQYTFYSYHHTPFGKIEVETDRGNITIGITGSGFIMGDMTTRASTRELFDCWILAKLVDDIYFKERGYHLPERYFRTLSGEDVAETGILHYNHRISFTKEDDK